MSKNDTTREWDLLQKGIDYNNRLSPSLYKVVEVNEAFLAGDQFRGMNTAGLTASCFNICDRVASYFNSFIMSQPVKPVVRPESGIDDKDEKLKKGVKIFNAAIQRKWEKLKMDQMLSEGLNDAFVSGDLCFYTYWDPDVIAGSYGQEPITDEMGNPVLDEMGEVQYKDVKIMGDFTTELVDSVDVHFGNPNSNIINKNGKAWQPYMLLSGREMVSTLRKEAKKYNKSADVKQIRSDTDTQYQAGTLSKIEHSDTDDETGKASYVIKFWYDDKTESVHYSKSVRSVIIREDVDLKIKHYPIVVMPFRKRKKSCRGHALLTSMIPNQIALNVIHMTLSAWVKLQAFPRLAYNKTLLPRGLSNNIFSAIGVNGPVSSDTIREINTGNINPVVMQLFESTKKNTLESIGMNDTMMGNVRPDNAAAIIAITNQSNVPLEQTKRALYQAVEDLMYIWIDYMNAYYDIPRMILTEENDKEEMVEFDTSEYKDIVWNVKVDVGPSSWYSELTVIETYSNLLQGGYLSFAQFLKGLPAGYLPDRDKLLQEIEGAADDKEFMFQVMAYFVDKMDPNTQAELNALAQKDPEAYEQKVREIIANQVSQPEQPDPNQLPTGQPGMTPEMLQM